MNKDISYGIGIGMIISDIAWFLFFILELTK